MKFIPINEEALNVPCEFEDGEYKATVFAAWQADVREALDIAMMKFLRKIEIEILKAEFYEGKTLSEIAKQTGETRQRIHQLRDRALRKISGPRQLREFEYLYPFSV